MATTITCPGCDKKLRVSKRPEAGKRVKCPSCGEAFLPDSADDADEEAIQEKPRARARATASARRQDDDDVDDHAPVRKRRRDNDDDEDAPLPRKKRKQKSGGKLIVFALLGSAMALVALTCCGVGVTGFVWPGWFLSKPDEDKLLARYLMPDADLVMGVSAKGLREAGKLDGIMATLEGAQKEAIPRDVADLVRECDRAVMSVNVSNAIQQGGPGPFNFQGGDAWPGMPQGPGPKRPAPPPGPPAAPPKMVMAVLMTSPAAVEKAKTAIRARPGNGGEEKLGKYPLMRQREQNGQVMLYAFPTPRTIVITSTPTTDAELTNILDKAQGKEPVAPQIAAMTTRVNQSTFWIAYSANAQARQFLQMLPLFMGNAQGVPPPVQAMAQALGKIKGAGLGVQMVAGGGARMQLHLECDDAGAATAIQAGANMIKEKALQDLAKDRAAPPTLRQDLNSLVFSADGSIATGSVALSGATIDALSGKFKGMGGMGRPPGR